MVPVLKNSVEKEGGQLRLDLTKLPPRVHRELVEVLSHTSTINSKRADEDSEISHASFRRRRVLVLYEIAESVSGPVSPGVLSQQLPTDEDPTATMNAKDAGIASTKAECDDVAVDIWSRNWKKRRDLANMTNEYERELLEAKDVALEEQIQAVLNSGFKEDPALEEDSIGFKPESSTRTFAPAWQERGLLGQSQYDSEPSIGKKGSLASQVNPIPRQQQQQQQQQGLMTRGMYKRHKVAKDARVKAQDFQEQG